MHPKLLDILKNKEVPIDNEQLAQYLSGKLDDTAAHDLEKELDKGGEMEADAWEGWQQGAAHQMLQQVEEINKNLEKQLHPTPIRPRKRPIKDLPVIWWVFGLVFVLIVLAWVMIRFLGN
jgi:hypothetical protein